MAMKHKDRTYTIVPFNFFSFGYLLKKRPGDPLLVLVSPSHREPLLSLPHSLHLLQLQVEHLDGAAADVMKNLKNLVKQTLDV